MGTGEPCPWIGLPRHIELARTGGQIDFDQVLARDVVSASVRHACSSDELKGGSTRCVRSLKACASQLSELLARLQIIAVALAMDAARPFHRNDAIPATSR
jgi:hypothetical protein